MSEATIPKSSSDQFDALIELLATDDAADDSNFHIAPEGAASTGLRDASGKLDFTKIRSLFKQRQSSRNTEDVSPSDSSVSNDPIPGIKLPEIVVEEPTALADISPPVNPQPPQWVGESSEIEMASSEGDFPHAQEDIVPQASEDSVMPNFDDALSKAYKEIEELQRRVLELETQAAELLKSNGPKEPGLGDCVSKPVIPTLTSTFGSVPPMDCTDAERASRFLIRADELVWRRSRYPNGPSAPVFSQDNIDAVTQRLSLWESIIRAPEPR